MACGVKIMACGVKIMACGVKIMACGVIILAYGVKLWHVESNYGLCQKITLVFVQATR